MILTPQKDNKIVEYIATPDGRHITELCVAYDTRLCKAQLKDGQWIDAVAKYSLDAERFLGLGGEFIE